MPERDWRAAGYLGVFGDTPRQGGGAAIGATFQYRVGPVTGGVLVETGGEIFDYSYVGAALVGGLGLRPTRHVRFDVLGGFGVHAYEGVGRGFLSNDPGAHGSTPYLGGRATLGYIFGEKLGHFEFGLYADYQDDLTRSHARYDYPSTGSGWFDGGGTGDHVVGTSRLGFGIELGGTHDVF